MEAQLTIPALGRVFRLKIGFLSPIDPTENSQNVRGVQERLKSLGFDPGPIDGINGNRTRAALGAFQSYCANEENRKRDPERIIDSGPVDGILGKKTLNALIKAFGS
jgi:peptidoglycan hydrolase-like protein with peptidoglycan-binding domain